MGAQWVTLLAALAPIIVSATRSIATGWVPDYDAAYVAVRSLDVFTEHDPVGSWPGMSAVGSERFTNVGPLPLWLLAPFTRVDPYWGAILGVAIVNIGAVVTTWFAVRAVFGPRGVISVMAATVVLELSFGSRSLIDARPQVAALLPFWALCWTTIALLGGRDRLIIAWLVAGTFTVHGHLSYAYPAVVLVVIGAAGYLRTVAPKWDSLAVRARTMFAMALGAFLWFPTLWDQITREGNLGKVLARDNSRESAGLSQAIRIVADSPFSYPFWWPRSLRRFEWPWAYALWTSSCIVAGWFAALALLGVWSFRRGSRRDVRMCLVAMALFVVAIVGAARIPSTATDSLPQNYFWLWPITLVCAVTLICVTADRLPRMDHQLEIGSAAVVALAALAIPTQQIFETWNIGDEIAAAGDSELLGQIRDNLDGIRFDIDQPILVDDVELRIVVSDYYNILGELRRDGLDFHFVDGSADLVRFGAQRCETGRERWRLKIVVGRDRPDLTRWDVLLGQTDGLAQALRGELVGLRDQTFQRLVDGAIEIDRRAVGALGGRGHDLLRIVDTPTGAQDELWWYLSPAVASGAATVQPQHRSDYDRWLSLEQARLGSYLLVYLTPNYYPARHGCNSN